MTAALTEGAYTRPPSALSANNVSADCRWRRQGAQGWSGGHVHARETGLLLGGNARVGLEDSLYTDRGILATSSAQQVERVVRIAREPGVELADPDEARDILGLPRH